MKGVISFVIFMFCLFSFASSKEQIYKISKEKLKAKVAELIPKLMKANSDDPKVNCHKSTDSSGKCLDLKSEEEGDFYQCPKDEMCNPETYTCMKIGYTGEKCSTNEDCLFGACKGGKCKYLGEGEKCSSNRHCGSDFYCHRSNEVCTKYVLQENAVCDFDANQCSPRFICLSGDQNLQCLRKGTAKEGEAVQNSLQCESFYVDTGLKCSSKYPAGDEYEMIKHVASYFKSLKWNSGDYERLNVRSSSIMGDYAYLMEYMDKYLRKEMPFIDDDTWKCMKPVYYPMIFSQLIEVCDMEEKDFKKMLDEVSISGLSGWAIFGIVIGCVAGVGLIGAGVYFFWYKKRASKDTLM